MFLAVVKKYLHTRASVKQHTRRYLFLFFILIQITFSLSCKNTIQVVEPPPPPQPPTPPVQQSTWDFVGLPNDNDISGITVVPDKPWIIYTGVRSDFSGGTKGKIYKTTNWGVSWKRVIDSIDSGEIVIDPKNDNILYAGLGPSNDCIPGVIKSTDAGENWFRIDSVMQLTWEEGAHVTIDPTNNKILYVGIAGAFGGRLYKSTDAGVTWVIIPPKWEGASYPLGDGVLGFAVDPKNPNELYLGLGWTGKLMKSFDGGLSFNVIRDTPLGLPIRFVVNPFRNNVVYLGCLDGGFWRSVDHGASWQNVSNGAFMNANVILIYKDSTLFLSQYSGVYKSIDDGVKWKRIGIVTTGIENVTTIGIDRKNKFIYASNGRSSTAGLYRYKINN